MKRIFFVCVCAATAMGCGVGLMDEPIQFPQEVPPKPAVVEAARPAPPPGALFRQDVNRTVDQGLGYFLQRVSVDADVTDGAFHGFRVTELRPADFWQGVDLQPGDVVTLVNGLPIERDIDAYQAFQSLRAAPALKVTLFRAGVQRELVYSIIDDGKGAPAVKPPTAAPAPAPREGSKPAPAAKT